VPGMYLVIILRYMKLYRLVIPLHHWRITMSTHPSIEDRKSRFSITYNAEMALT